MNGVGEHEGTVCELVVVILLALVEDLVEVGLVILHAVDGAGAYVLVCSLEGAALMRLFHAGVLHVAVIFDLGLEARVVLLAFDVVSCEAGCLCDRASVS